MAIQPDITFRDAVNPSSVLGALSYVMSTLGSNFLPVISGRNSLPVKLRLYNNWALNVGIAVAMNANLTVYDGAGSGSHTALKAPVSQSWVRVYESGFGESVGANPGITAFAGSQTAVGGAASHGAFYNVYPIEVGSDGLYDGQIRAGSNTNGTGFVEITSYVNVPLSAPTNSWNFVMTLNYQWVP